MTLVPPDGARVRKLLHIIFKYSNREKKHEITNEITTKIASLQSLLVSTSTRRVDEYNVHLFDIEIP